MGVYVDTGGAIGTGDLDTVTVKGTGGTGSGGYNVGVRVANTDDGPAAEITSGGGDVSVSGAGMSGSAVSPSFVGPDVSIGNGYSYGVQVGSEGWITAGGTGALTITGDSNTTTGTNQVGVYVGGLDATIGTSNGDISVTGIGGGDSSDDGSEDNFGVEVVSGGLVSPGGYGGVAITGTGGDGGGGDNAGVEIGALLGVGKLGMIGSDGETLAGAIVESSGGNVSVTGTGGGDGTASAYNAGVAVIDGGQILGVNDAFVSVHGTGGNSSGGDDVGVSIGSGGYVGTSGIGGVSVSGYGGTSGSYNSGVNVSDAGLMVESGGADGVRSRRGLGKWL